MKITAAAALILVCLIASSLARVQPINAQYQNDITINADGSIIPSSALIKQTGNTYSLTTDLIGNIKVQRNNTVLNGNGHTLGGWLAICGSSAISNVTVRELIVTGTGTVGEAVSLQHYFNTFYSRFSIATFQASNVNLINNTVMDTKGQYDSVAININGGSSNTISGNSILNNTDGLSFGHSKNNLIYGNTIADNGGAPSGMMGNYGISFFDSSNNVVYNNSFSNNTFQATSIWSSTNNTWDNGKIGNFWSDYKTRYPNASEINSTEISDTPYVVNENNIDRYPLIYPIDFSSESTPLKDLEPFPSLPFIVAFVVTVAVVGVGLLFYFKKRK